MMQLCNHQADSGWQATCLPLLRGCTAATPPFRCLLGQLLIKGRFSFWPRFCCRWNLLRILFSSLHLFSAHTLTLAFSFMDRFTHLFLCVFSSPCLWDGVFHLLPPGLFQQPGLPSYCGPKNLPGRLWAVSFATIVIGCPSPQKTGATHPRPQVVHLSLRCLPGAGKDRVPYSPCHTWAGDGPQTVLRCWGSLRLQDLAVFLCAILSGQGHNRIW